MKVRVVSTTRLNSKIQTTILSILNTKDQVKGHQKPYFYMGKVMGKSKIAWESESGQRSQGAGRKGFEIQILFDFSKLVSTKSIFLDPIRLDQIQLN